MYRRIGVFACTAALAATPALAEAGGNVIRGEAYSKSMCASCHSITDTAASTNPAAKPFRSMKLSYDSGEAFAKWLNTGHPVIPSTMVTASQADDIIAYMATLKKSD